MCRAEPRATGAFSQDKFAEWWDDWVPGKILISLRGRADEKSCKSNIDHRHQNEILSVFAQPLPPPMGRRQLCPLPCVALYNCFATLKMRHALCTLISQSLNEKFDQLIFLVGFHDFISAGFGPGRKIGQ